MRTVLVPLTRCFCILITIASGQGAKVHSNIFDPEAISQIYRTAVKNNEAVILSFDNGPYSGDDRYENTGIEYKKAENYGHNRITNLKELLKFVHHKNYLEKLKDLPTKLTYKYGPLRSKKTTGATTKEIRQDVLNKLMGSRNEMQCIQKQICDQNCKIENDVNCKVKCDISFKCDKEKKKTPKEEDCSSEDNSFPLTTPDCSAESNTVPPPYQKGSEESSDCEDD